MSARVGTVTATGWTTGHIQWVRAEVFLFRALGVKKKKTIIFHNSRAVLKCGVG